MSTVITTRLAVGRAGLRTKYYPREPSHEISRIKFKPHLCRLGDTAILHLHLLAPPFARWKEALRT